MSYVLIQHQVKSYSDFEAVFVGGTARRKRMGSRGGKVLRDARDASNIVILLEWEDAEKAREWAESFESREAAEWATSRATPTIVIMEDILEVES